MKPVEVVKHESGPEANRIPMLQVMIDVSSFFGEIVRALEKFAIVVKVMNPNFKAVAGELVAQQPGGRVTTLRYKAEAGAETKGALEFH